MSENIPFLSEQKNTNVENNATEKVLFPNSRKILFLTTVTTLMVVALCICHSWFPSDPCEGINNLEACNFTNKLSFIEMHQIKYQIDKQKEEFNHIGRGGEENAQKRDKAIKKILKLTEKYKYQKNHQEKCFIAKTEAYKNARFYQKMFVYFAAFIVYFVTFPILYYLYQKGKQSLSLTTANENEKAKVQKAQLTSIVIFLLTCSVILGLTYFVDFYLPLDMDVNDLLNVPSKYEMCN